MTTNIYVCGIGEASEPSIEAMRSGIPIDKVYIINNADAAGRYRESEEEVREACRAARIPEVRTVHVDIYDFNDVVEALMELDADEAELCGDVRFHVNFTSGTRVMSGAMVCASMMIGAELCYVRGPGAGPGETVDRRVLRIQPANLREIRDLTAVQKDIFLEIGPAGRGNADLVRPGRAKSTLSFHTKALAEMGLVERRQEGRDVEWRLTEKGRSTYAVLSRSRIGPASAGKGARKTRVRVPRGPPAAARTRLHPAAGGLAGSGRGRRLFFFFCPDGSPPRPSCGRSGGPPSASSATGSGWTCAPRMPPCRPCAERARRPPPSKYLRRP